MKKNTASLLRNAIIITGLLVLALSSFTADFTPIPVTGSSAEEVSANVVPSLNDFVAAVSNGDATVVRGVYVPDVFALRVQQQPVGQAGHVTSVVGVVSQFGYAAQSGVTGLIAHNYLSGELFFNLEIDQEVIVVYGDGSEQRYVVRDLQQYQALSPNSPYSDFLNLDTNEKLSSTDLFNKVYTGAHHVTFQTCIANNGNLTWGRLFVIAEPLES